MKHAALIFLLAIGLYLAWYYAPTTTKKPIKKFIKRHAAMITLVLVLLGAGIAAAFYINSFTIL